MLNFTSILTIITRYASLLSNFLLVALSIKIWGSEGRGEIALMITNISIISILTNITCGSSIAFNAKNHNPFNLLIVIVIGGFLFSLAGGIIFSIFFKFNNTLFLIGIPFLMSISAGINAMFLGLSKINTYNNLGLVTSISTFIILLVLYSLDPTITLSFYFYSLAGSIVLSILIGMYLLQGHFHHLDFNMTKNEIYDLLIYGFKNEVSNFFQFLNYRFSYYIVASNFGLKTLGVFSTAMSLAETIWVISRSLSSIHYANVLNSNDSEVNYRNTVKKANTSLLLSCLGVTLLLAIPGSWYQFVFTKDFENVKSMMLLITPGILFIAYSNIHGHYFSAKNIQNVLIIKSVLGFTLCLTFLYVLKSYGLNSIFIAMNIAYIVPSVYLIYKFIQKKTPYPRIKA